MPKHRSFNADRFLDKFDGREHYLRDFAAIWKERNPSLNLEEFSIEAFRQWMLNSNDEGKDDLLEALYQVYDLCTERGYQHLQAASQDVGYVPDPDNILPVECLSILVRTHRKLVFQNAYDRNNFIRAERFSIYQGACGKPINDLKLVTRKFKRRLARVFKQIKNSDRVLVRSYQEGERINFVVYHEKRVKATLLLRGPVTRLKVRPVIYRPAQQDYISYHSESGRVEIEAGIASEEEKLRTTFAEVCLGDATFFEGSNSADRVCLEVIAEPDFELRCPEGVTAKIVSLRFDLQQKQNPHFAVRSQDVLDTLQRNQLRVKISGTDIMGVVIKIFFPGDKRGKRIELSGTKSVSFNRATHADEVVNLITEWGLLLGSEDREDIVEPDLEASAFVGSTAAFTS